MKFLPKHTLWSRGIWSLLLCTSCAEAVRQTGRKSNVGRCQLAWGVAGVRGRLEVGIIDGAAVPEGA